jgi:hypothetical protein
MVYQNKYERSVLLLAQGGMKYGIEILQTIDCVQFTNNRLCPDLSHDLGYKI